ncbi:hypothetical protein KM043_018193 [Ampulex compressa]|nr:hypothetical protein KM043_018193 [Ampulex compressa]
MWFYAYLNWYSVYTISCKAETVNMKDAGPHNTMMYNKITSNIQQYRDSNARDHHCFFLGACVLRRNMGTKDIDGKYELKEV